MKIYKATNITKTSFQANWESLINAISYFLDVATNNNFTSFVSGYQNKEVTTNFDDVTGLSDMSHYFYRVKANLQNDTGTAESGTTTLLTDSDKAWTVDEFVGMFIRITAGTGVGQNKEITANTETEITASFDTAPDETSVYEIHHISDYSYVMEVVTGFFVSGMSIEFGNLVADLFNIQGFTIEVSTDFNFQAIIRDIDGNKVNSAHCLIIMEDWTNKGSWNPNTDPDPDSPSEGDYYTISATGENDIIGEIEEFTIVDLLVYLNSTWQIKKRRNVYTDTFGIANMIIEYNINNLFIVEKAGYQQEKQILNYISGEQQYNLVLYPIVSVIITQKGYAVNTNVKNRINNVFN